MLVFAFVFVVVSCHSPSPFEFNGYSVTSFVLPVAIADKVHSNRLSPCFEPAE